jgi:hypothetical protein
MAPQRKPGNNNGKGGSGGGGNGGGGNEDPGDDDPGDDDEQPLTRTEVLKLVNGAVSGQLARKLGPAIEAGMAPVLAKLDALKKPADDEDDEDPNAGDDPGDDPPAPKKGKGGKPDPVVAKLQREQAALKRQLDEANAQRTKEAEARKNAAIDSTLTSALTEIGVDKHRMRGALAVHKGSAYVDDAGNVLFKIKRDGYEEDLEPGAFLKEWSGTDEGKSYIAPTGASGGAGARAPKPAGATRKPAPTSPEAKAQKIADAKTSLLSAVAGELAGGTVAIE